MKKKPFYLYAILFLIFAVFENANAQETEGTIYSSAGIEKKPEFPGGIQEFYNYIGANFVTPGDKEFKGGKIIASFVVEKDGSIADVSVLRDIGFGTADETIRVLKASPLWIPGEQSGKKVRVSYTLPLNIQPPPVEEVDEMEVYDSKVVMTKPEFTGGNTSFFSFIRSNFRAPDRSGLNGKVAISFIVETDGSLTDIKVLADEVGNGAGNEAIRVLKLSPKWIPAKQDGKPVRCNFVIPITISTP